MKLRVLGDRSINELKNTTRGSIQAAKKTWPHANVDYLTPKHIGFTVSDPEFRTKHSVIYYNEKPFDKSWMCDCMWFSIRSMYCKHILSIFIRLRNDPDFLKKIRENIEFY